MQTLLERYNSALDFYANSTFLRKPKHLESFELYCVWKARRMAGYSRTKEIISQPIDK